eukprot:TRINITY_DN11982_c0_g1_i1.p1 TRINITY_DN11982_c0_g1~~TRINITY_DN11982_c0_g1_i1.p1  ORF type:complete len:945 (-),score=231.40 TRINITY_DN11982_c0_g1_i1:393-3227(-)
MRPTNGRSRNAPIKAVVQTTGPRRPNGNKHLQVESIVPTGDDVSMQEAASAAGHLGGGGGGVGGSMPQLVKLRDDLEQLFERGGTGGDAQMTMSDEVWAQTQLRQFALAHEEAMRIDAELAAHREAANHLDDGIERLRRQLNAGQLNGGRAQLPQAPAGLLREAPAMSATTSMPPGLTLRLAAATAATREVEMQKLEEERLQLLSLLDSQRHLINFQQQVEAQNQQLMLQRVRLQASTPQALGMLAGPSWRLPTPATATAPGAYVGTVTRFNMEKGWGFIAYSGQDIFFHRQSCCGVSVNVGDHVRFDVEESSKKPGKIAATNVSLVPAEPLRIPDYDGPQLLGSESLSSLSGAPSVRRGDSKGKGETTPQAAWPRPKGSRTGKSVGKGGAPSGGKGKTTLDQDETLRKCLEDLRHEDARKIFIARRINKLGFQSKTILEQHYSWYGIVEQVLVAHCMVRPSQAENVAPRLRAGNFGLVVMEDAETVEKILAEGEEQYVNGEFICVRRFEKKIDADTYLAHEDWSHVQVARDNEKTSASASAAGGQGNARSSQRTRTSSVGAEADGAETEESTASSASTISPSAGNDEGSSGWSHATTASSMGSRRHAADHGRGSGRSKEPKADAAMAMLHANALSGKPLQQALETFLKCVEDSADPLGMTPERNEQVNALANNAKELLKPLEDYQIELYHEMVSKGVIPKGEPPAGLLSAPTSSHGAAEGAEDSSYGLDQSQSSSGKEAAGGQQSNRGSAPGKNSGGETLKTAKKAAEGAKTQESKPPAKDTLREYLVELRSEDATCVFAVRRINKLGFRAKDLVEHHFSQYGEVRRVLVAPSKVRPFGDCSEREQRTRPGGLGLIVMSSSQSVEYVHSLGEEQMVAGHPIRVQRFRRPRDKTDEATSGSNNGTGSTTAASGTTWEDTTAAGTTTPEASEGTDADRGAGGNSS